MGFYYILGYNFLTGEEDFLKPCSDKNSATTSHDNFLKLVYADAKQVWNLKCPIPCRQTTYSASIRYFHKHSLVDPSNNIVNDISESNIVIALGYETLSIEEQVESLVYDVGSFLAAAGGNLGLFLGFSCFSVLISIFRNLQSCYEKYVQLQ